MQSLIGLSRGISRSNAEMKFINKHIKTNLLNAAKITKTLLQCNPNTKYGTMITLFSKILYVKICRYDNM